MSEDQYIEMHMFLQKEDNSDWTEGDIDGYFEDFLEFIDNKNLLAGGAVGYMKSEDEECTYCDGSGFKEVVEEEDRCETCGGSGRKEDTEPTSSPEAKEDWNTLYAPVSQLEENSPPKGKVEGSSPSGSASIESDEDIVDQLFSDAPRRAGKRPLKD